MTSLVVTDADVAELIERTAAAAKAYIRGDMSTYSSLIRHGDDPSDEPTLAPGRTLEHRGSDEARGLPGSRLDVAYLNYFR